MKTISRYIMTLALLITAVGGAWAQELSESFTTNTSAAVYTGEHFKITVGDVGDGGGFYLAENKYATIEALNGEIITKVELTKGYYYINNFYCEVGTTNISGDVATVSGVNNTSLTFTASGALQIKAVKVYYTDPNAVEVTINAAEEGATFTEASFAMPAFDATADYELVRDITQQVDLEVRIDGTASTRIRIAKDTEGHYNFVTTKGWQYAAVDKINNVNLTNGELNYSFKKKEGEEYVGKSELSPGIWRLEATANEGKPYVGTIYGHDIELYAGYEITVPAGEYATFYKDENLYTEDENAELYTISEVNATQAVLSNAVQIMPKNTPMLVYNKGTEEKTFLLIPTEDEANQVTAANEFKGTLSTMGMPGSTSITDYYVCTGKAFRWVKNAGTIGANKCWLQIGEQPATTRANTRSIVGGGNTTGIDGIENDESAVEGYYDLNGRKLQGKPTRGGIYIQNGRKVIVR